MTTGVARAPRAAAGRAPSSSSSRGGRAAATPRASRRCSTCSPTRTPASRSSTRPSPAAPAPTRRPSWPTGCIAGRPARLVPAPRRQGAADRHRGRQGRGPHEPLRRGGLARRVPRAPARADHRRRQALLGAGEHPPLERALVQPGRPRGGRASTAPPEDLGRVPRPRPRRSKAEGKIRARRSARRGPRSTCSRTCCSASSAPTSTPGLWDGTTDWESAEVIAALDMFTEVLDALEPRRRRPPTGSRRSTRSSRATPPTTSWATGPTPTSASRRSWPGRTTTTPTASPGTDGVFNFLSDTFTLPVGRPAPGRGARSGSSWRGSQEGQDPFNPLKGSIPARTDGDTSLYTDYLATPLEDWTDEGTTIVGSLAHGVVANNAWKAEIDSALRRSSAAVTRRRSPPR